MTVIGGLVVAVIVAILLIAVVALVLRMLMRRVVAVSRPRKVVMATGALAGVDLARSTATVAPGLYGLWFGDDFKHHAQVGEVIADTDAVITRRVVSSSAPLSSTSFPAHWTGHTQRGPGDAGSYIDVTIPMRDGSRTPAWLYPSGNPEATWVVHVQGIRTSRLVTLRAVEPMQQVGSTSLVVTYRGAGDGPTEKASRLGESEWTDLADAVKFARQHGARRVVVVAWSMGAGLALELARREPSSVDDVILICPATDWPGIVRHAASRAHLPRIVSEAAIAALATPILCRLAGLDRPLNLRDLAWSKPGDLKVPALVIHSKGDEEIPFRLTETFAGAHPGLVTLVETAPAPHGWEANVDPATFNEALQRRLSV